MILGNRIGEGCPGKIDDGVQFGIADAVRAIFVAREGVTGMIPLHGLHGGGDRRRRFTTPIRSPATATGPGPTERTRRRDDFRRIAIRTSLLYVVGNGVGLFSCPESENSELVASHESN